MKKHFLKSFALLAMLFSALTMSAKQYCQEPLTLNGGATIQLSCELVSAGNYRITIEGENLAGLGGSFYNPGGVDLRTAITTNTATKIVCDIEAASAPTLYTPLYVLCPGEQNIDWPNDIDWTGTCGEGGETPSTPEPEEPEVTDKWANVDWVEDSDNKYKVSHECLSSVVNVQQPPWAAEKGIYITAPAGISDCTVNGKIDGAGMILYLSSFTAKETEVTITHGLGSCTFWVYYADGTEDGGETPSTPTEIYDVNFALASNGSSAEATSGDAAQAIDNNAGTRWESAQEDPQTWTLDLGQARIFNTLEIVWEGAYGKTFTVSASDDKENWTPVWTVEDQQLEGFPYTQTQVIDKTTARYIQFHGTARGTGYGYSFWEFRVYLAGVSTFTSLEAKPATNLTKIGEGNAITLTAKDQNGQLIATPDGVTYTITPADAGTITNNIYTPARIGLASIVATIGEVSAPAFEVLAYDGENVALSPDINASKIVAQSDFAPSGTDAWHAIDGNEGSVWQGSATNGGAGDEESRTYDSWFVVDFGGYYDINLVSIKFEGACSQEYTVAFSADNATWATAYEYVGNAGVYGHTKLIYGNDLQNNTKARYARFKSTKAATEWGMKMFEFKAFGTPWVAPADDVKPVMGTATLVSNTHNTAVIAVTATDNEEVGKYHVVSATPAYDKMVVPTDGKITVTDLTPSTEYALTITAVDLAGNESENAATMEVTTDKYDEAPSGLPTVPTYPDNQVKAVYSETYNADCNFGEWGSGTQYTQDTYGKKYVTTNLGYFGLFEFALNCSNLEALHLDVWTADDMTFRVVPIHGAAEVGVTVSLKGQQWNSVEIPLSDYVGVPDWTNVYQIKIDNASNRTFWLNNIYFYTTQAPDTDNEAPTAVTATATPSYFSVTIHAKATDNSGAVIYEVKNGEDVLASRTGVSAENTDIVVSNLTPNTDYILTLVAKDESANAAEPVNIAVKTLEAPAPAPVPTHAAENVYAIYSDAYTSPVYFGIGGWGQATVATEGNLAAEDKAYLLQNTNYLGWEINNNQPINVSAYNKVHLDVYALADGSLQFTPISLATPNNKENVQTLTLKEGWNQFDIDCATFTGVEFDKVIQIKFAEGGNATYFIDNVYFYKPAVGSAVENTQVEVQSQKLIRNGVLYIIRNGVTYDVMGRVVR
ncbi:MAG: discoidin domain-containing protein [Paludibacteraceae bacterium]|nr:discoidin domain-containing protein [Paludibacteraceae bacterium]